ncbi:sugar-transfer associated ATP-grasp domain-containing protein [Clostridium perfringens]
MRFINEKILKIKEFRYRKTYYKNDEKMIEAMDRFKKSIDKKDLNKIKEEICLCKKFWGCFPSHYYRYNLYEKNISKEELLSYIPEYFFYNLFLSKYDSIELDEKLSNKIELYKLFKELDIKQNETDFFFINNKIYNSEFNEISIDNMFKSLNDKKYKKLFIKPADGQGGYGIIIIDYVDGKYLNKNGEIMTKEKFKELLRNGDYLIQKQILQSDQMNKIYNKSVNTFRIATENINGNVRIVCSTLRVGKDGNEVDNSAQDGIVVGVDILTGKLTTNGVTEKTKVYKKHPNSGFIFKNYNINNWNEVKEFAESSAKKMKEYTYLGWDIAITDNGPIAIETNLGFGLDHYQVVLGGLASNFNIKNPELYWKGLE